MTKLFLYFLQLGSTGFGGPIALIGLMEQHWVDKKKSLTREDFQKIVAAAKLFPGPLATLIAIRIGRKVEGKTGGFLAGIGLIAPAFFLILLLAKISLNPQLMMGLNLGGLALSILASIKFVRPLISTQTLLYFFIGGLLTFYFPSQEIIFLLAAGILSVIFNRFRSTLLEPSMSIVALIFFESFKASLFTFGSGLAIVPVLKAIYIDRYQWLTPHDFLYSLSLSQMTPGPLVILTTSLGNQIAQFPGAIAATLGTFLPTFIFGIFLMPLLELRLLSSPILKIFFTGMLPAVGGAILASVLRLTLFAVTGPNDSVVSSRILVLTALCLVGTKIHPILLLITGAALVFLESLFGIIQ